MGKAFCALFLSALAVYCTATPVTYVIAPVGKEIVYDYHTLVDTGTHRPVHYVSEYEMRAKLHIQGIKTDMVSVYLTSMTTTMYNGEVKPRDEIHTTYLPIDSDTLKLPFQIQYDTNGKFLEIIFDRKDMEWSMNMKKGIASFLQFDRSGKAGSVDFLTKVIEDGVNGPCEWNYDVSRRDDEFTLVKLMVDQQLGSELSKTGERVYLINREGWIKKMISTGHVMLHPNRAQNEIYMSRVTQNMTMLEEVAIGSQMLVKDQVVMKSLRAVDVRKKCETPINTVIDWFGGNIQGTVETHVRKIHDHLEQLTMFMDKNQLNLEQPDLVNSKLVNHILMHLEYFDLSTLEHTFVDLQEKTSNGNAKELRKLNLFVQLLPHVGTRQSILFIRNLIRKQKINDVLAVRVVKDIATHVECPNDELLHELEDMLTIGTPNSKIQRACVLAFASLIKRTFEDDENSPTLEKYITMFVQKMKDTTIYSTKLLYLQGLANIRVGSVAKHLEPIVSGEIPVEDRLRVMALWAMLPRITRDHKMLMRVALPILANPKNGAELRQVAYTCYVKLENPSVSHFMNLYWFMIAERDEHLYNFHYTTMESLSKTDNIPWNRDQQLTVNEIAKLILRLSRKPMISRPLDGIHISHYEQYGMGLTLQTGFLQTKTAINTYLKIDTKINGHTVDLLTILARKPTSSENRVNPVKNMGDLNSILTKSQHPIDVIIKRQDRVIMILVEQDFSLETLFDLLTSLDLIDSKHVDSITNQIISMPLVVAKYLTNDVGQTVRISNRFTALHSLKFNFVKDKMDLKWKMFSTTGWVLGAYNPISHVWQGVKTTESLAMAVPLNLVGGRRPVLKVVMKKVGVDDVIGMKEHVMMDVFVVGVMDNVELKKYCGDCRVIQPITRGDVYKKTIPVMKSNWDFMGRRMEATLFDCELDISRGSLISNIHELEDHLNHGTYTTDTLFQTIKMFKTIFQLRSDHYGTCGFSVRLLPMDNVDRVEFTMDPSQSVGTPTSKVYLAQMNSAVTVGMAVKSVQNKDLVNYVGTMKLNLGEMHRDLTVTFQGVKKVMDVEKYKLAMDVDVKLGSTNLDGKFKIAMGPVGGVGIMEFIMKGSMSDEQQLIKSRDGWNHNECQKEIEIRTGTILPVGYACAEAMTTLRKYLVEMNVVEDHKNYWIRYFIHRLEALGMKYSDYILPESETHNVHFEEGVGKTLSMEVFFPMNREEVDVKLSVADKVIPFEGLPARMLDTEPFFGHIELLKYITPDNFFYGMTHIPKSFSFETAMKRTCIVGGEQMMNDRAHVDRNVLENDWTVYLQGSFESKDAFTVWMKKGNQQHKILTKIMVGADTYEEVMTSGSIKVMVNGQEVVFDSIHKDVNNFQMVQPYPSMMILGTKSFGLHMIRELGDVRIDVPDRLIDNLVGKCIKA